MHASTTNMRISDKRLTHREMMDDVYDALEQTFADHEADQRDQQFAGEEY